MEDLQRVLICMLQSRSEFRIHKIPLDRYFSSSDRAGPSSTTRRRRRSSDFSLVKCTTRSRRPVQSKSIRKNRPIGFGRFARYLRMNKTRAAPLFPKPYFSFRCLGCGRGELPEKMAMAVLGSKIYLIGGLLRNTNAWPRKYALSRAVYSIDMSGSDDSSPPEVVKMSCELNCGKREPIAWTIGDKIYAMPKSFTNPHFLEDSGTPNPGRLFECFDPESNAWTVLRSPPVLGREEDYDDADDPFLVKSHAVVGLNLVISMEAGLVFTFDTSRPSRGWRRIVFTLSPSRSLKFLPFSCQFSLPCHETTSSGLGIHVCSFDEGALSNPEAKHVGISISSLEGIEMIKQEHLVEHNSISMVTGLEKGMALSARAGYDRDILDKGSRLHYNFNVFGFGEDNQVSSISSALFTARSELECMNFIAFFMMKC